MGKIADTVGSFIKGLVGIRGSPHDTLAKLRKKQAKSAAEGNTEKQKQEQPQPAKGKVHINIKRPKPEPPPGPPETEPDPTQQEPPNSPYVKTATGKRQRRRGLRPKDLGRDAAYQAQFRKDNGVVEHIVDGKLDESREIVRKRLAEIYARKLVEMKKILGVRFARAILGEATRYKVVPVRIRKGKVQRRKKVSNLPGYTFRKAKGGSAKFTKMTVKERRDRRMGQRRGKIRRRAKRAIAKQRFERSLRKRKALGL
jgi:hypothetical protein